MWKKVLVAILAVLVVGVAILGYSSLPSGVHDPCRAHIVVGVLNFFSFWVKVKESLGYGHFLNNIRLYQKKIVLDGELPSARYGDVQVKRTAIAKVPVIVYRPVNAPVVSPAMIYFHGGGYSLLTADDYDMMTYVYAKTTNMVVISVNYRRAPQFPFPVPVQDCLEVTRNLLKHGSKLGVDVSKVGVAGDGTGGSLAASVALTLTREASDLPSLKFQLLSHPSLQAFDFSLPSFIDHNNTMPLLTTRTMAAFISLYIGLNESDTYYFSSIISENRHISPQMRASKFAQYVRVDLLPKMFQTPKTTPPPAASTFDSHIFSKIKSIVTNPLFSPLMSSNLTGLPPAFIHASEFDLLRDDALLYSKRLQDAGVRVKIHFGHGGFHGDTLTMLLGKYLWVQSGKMAFTSSCDFIKTIIKN
uniref:Alpha/beta hydrolase fold-3 domain-containing protein n=1 Tax=Biomphalaria glabrata TaxID=6526 RepID=A0A2C9JLN5_BIOGL